MKHQLIITFILLLLSTLGFGQTEVQIDSIFANWIDQPKKPGGAALVLRRDSVIYSRGFGNADIINNIPNTANTKFQLAGMSKHFTAFAIFLLEEQGKLHLTDDVRKYLPQLKGYGKVITIKHLLSQTSGLNDFWTLRLLLGWKEIDTFTQQDALNIVYAQETLGFSPGEAYNNTETESLLLAEIVAKVSKQSFSVFCAENIFKPLKMYNTVFVDNADTLMQDLAIAYQATENGFQQSQMPYANFGSTNLYSSVNDLAIWELNMQSSIVGSQSIFEQMNTPAQLNDGSMIDPTNGRVTLGQQFLHKERGVLNIYQTGGLGGYTSSIFKFLNDEFTVIVLSNSGESYTGYLGMQTAYLFLEESFKTPAVVDFSTLHTKKISGKKLKSYAGHYWDKLGAVSREISLENDTLRYVRSNGNSSPLLPLGKDVFQMVSGGDEKILFTFSQKQGTKYMDLTIGESAPIVLTDYTPVELDKNNFARYAGTYYCEELHTVYEFVIENDRLLAKNIRKEPIRFTPVSKNLFEGSAWFFGAISFDMNDANEPIGFHIFTDYIRNVYFKKI